MAKLCIAKENVWFEQGKYEGAETRYQEIIAERHSGLAIEGKAVPVEGKTVSAAPVEKKAAPNHITSQFEKAKSFIQESLKTVPGSRASSSMEQRIAQLEKENSELKSTLQAVQSRLCLLEGRVGKLDGETADTKAPPPAQSKPAEDEEEEEDFDLFGSDDDEEVDAEAEKLKQQRLEAYQEKKAKKGQVIAKSNIILEVKPWDDETDMKDIEKVVRAVETDGLKWGASKLVPVGYGIKKLQITCVVEDDKVGTDFLEESITAHEELVQSVDIVAFNKI